MHDFFLRLGEKKVLNEALFNHNAHSQVRGTLDKVVKQFRTKSSDGKLLLRMNIFHILQLNVVSSVRPIQSK